ncbi:MAG TPA: alpha/beta hydrolase [Solirubrobacteraceae bacterium]|jgi:triacylglycerol lipase|nr:alpha/beta hydrolase [Solirubrobacteraceae bacterium]
MTAGDTFPRVAPLWGELRYGGELARLLAREALWRPRAGAAAPPVLLIPGFMAGDSSLRVLRRWLERRGHRVAVSGLRANVECAGQLVARMQAQLRSLAAEQGRPVFLIGQSRGGAIARSLAVREPQATCGLVMLGSPVCDPLAVSAPVLGTVALLARLGDLGLPGVLSSRCWDGECCAALRGEMSEPLAPHIRAVSVFSQSDGIVDWRACLDPHCEAVEVSSSHCGMSVHPQVYELLARVLADRTETPRAPAARPRRRPRGVSSAAEAVG